MNKIQEISAALIKGKDAFDAIMSLPDCVCFNVEELYSANVNTKESLEEWSGQIVEGDNLEYMEYLLKEGSMKGKIQLIYIDPPFFSNSKYQASVRLETEELGKSPVIKTGAYNDTWEDSLTQYLTMLSVRLYMMRELLTDDGGIWVHLDWHGSHYVRILMDEIFGNDNFVNEVIWTYKSGGASKNSFARKHDTLLFYRKSDNLKFNPLQEKSYNRDLKPYNFKGVEEFQDDYGWYTKVNMKDVWTVDMVGRTSAERTGYATQKPEKLLERIIMSCSDEGDLVADFFAGSGTLGAVAERLNRRWIMCDEGDVAVSMQIERLCNVKHPDNNAGSFIVRRRENSSDDEAEQLVKCRTEDGKISIADYIPDVLRLRDSDADIAAEYIRNDCRSCIRFWSVDENYDGILHRTSHIERGTDAWEFDSAGSGKTDVVGYDVFGNRFQCTDEVIDREL